MTLFSGNPPALRWPPAFARQFIVKVAGLALLALTGLGTVFYYTYLTIQHDMDLITARQKNVFEVFYQRAKILKVENITSYLAQHHLLDQPPLPNSVGSDYLYGYDLKSKYRFADIPLQYPAANLLNTFRYALSYPEVINIYTIWNDYRLIGMVADNNVLPTRLAPIKVDLMTLPAWYHYFGCASFAPGRPLCSADEAFVSDIEIDSFSMRNTIVMYFPFIHQSGRGGYKYGLLGIDIAVDEAFNDVLHPFDTINPTRTNISFEAAEPCRPRHLCLSKPFMRTKAGDDLYLKWSYSWFDFVKLALQSAAFKVYLIVLLLGMVAWKQIYLRLRTLAHTDHLTRLPRRDVLCQSLLHEHDYLMILDIDNFKSINDTYGHSVGDLALVAAPYLESDPRLAQLGELLAQVGQVQFENDAFTQEITLTAPLEIVAEESLLPVEPEWPAEVLLPEVAEPHTTILTETALEVAPVEASEPVAWENIDTGKEFQALFFEVAGVTFAVPLTELGGIHQLGGCV